MSPQADIHQADVSRRPRAKSFLYTNSAAHSNEAAVTLWAREWYKVEDVTGRVQRTRIGSANISIKNLFTTQLSV